MLSDWIKKLKFNDMCSVQKSSNFCSRMLEMHVSEAQISNFFLGRMLPDPPRNLWVFCISAYSKAFIVPCLELIENPALCYRKESPRAVVKGWKQFYHWNQSLNTSLQTIQNKYTSTSILRNNKRKENWRTQNSK